MPLALLLFAVLSSQPDVGSQRTISTAWGELRELDGPAGIWRFDVARPPPDRLVAIPADFPAIVRVWREGDRERVPLSLVHDAGAKRLRVELPADAARGTSGTPVLVVETADKSGQRPDGRIVFRPQDAETRGATAKLESDDGLPRIGSWTDPSDAVSWKFRATRPGTYDVELTYALADGNETMIEFALADAKIAAKLNSTGAWSRYGSQSVGKISVPKPGEHRLLLSSTKKTGTAVMNLAAVTLRPAGEGQPIIQADDGSVTLHARDVTILGVQVQYEPKPEKNTVGYWTNVSDRVAWDFTLATPKRFEVEILQGCGKDQGGSEVEIRIGDQTLKFVVEDTGHFQNFVARKVGVVTLDEPGPKTLVVRPLRKAGVAVMDLRQVRLVPVN